MLFVCGFLLGLSSFTYLAECSGCIFVLKLRCVLYVIFGVFRFVWAVHVFHFVRRAPKESEGESGRAEEGKKSGLKDHRQSNNLNEAQSNRPVYIRYNTISAAHENKWTYHIKWLKPGAAYVFFSSSFVSREIIRGHSTHGVLDPWLFRCVVFFFLFWLRFEMMRIK